MGGLDVQAGEERMEAGHEAKAGEEGKEGGQDIQDGDERREAGQGTETGEERRKSKQEAQANEERKKRQNKKIASKANGKYKCDQCKELFLNNDEVNDHMKNYHKDKYISILEIKLKESEQQVHKLVEDSEKLKIENKELISIKQINKKSTKRNTGDNYDHEDEIELDSERELLKGKQNGFKRVGPQSQSEQFFNCHVCSFQFKNRDFLDKHIRQHEDQKKTMH